MMKKIAIGNDHGAFGLKKAVTDYLYANGYEVIDCGATQEGVSVDYPDFAAKVTALVASKQADLGVLLCGTGIGMSMAANKVKGIRAAVCTDSFTGGVTRAHNDANVLCMGERVTGIGVAIETLKAFLTTEFEGGRHATRVGKIETL